jgi:hypothetical protein
MSVVATVVGTLLGILVVVVAMLWVFCPLNRLFPCCPRRHQAVVDEAYANRVHAARRVHADAQAVYPDPSDMDAVERANAARGPPIRMEEYHFGPPPHLQADAVTPKFVIQVSDFVLIFVNYRKFLKLSDVPLIII